MLKNLFEQGYFNYRDFIVENTKKLSLSSLEAMILIEMLDEFKNDKRILIDVISNSLLEKRSKIEEAMSSLNEKGFYSIYVSYENGLGEEVASLDGFFKTAEAIIENKPISDKGDELYSVIEYLNGVLNRILSSQEIEIVTSLVKDDCYTLADFKNAVDTKLKNKVITIKSLARALATKQDTVKVSSKNDLMKDFIKTVK